VKRRVYAVTGKLEMFEEITAPWTYLFIPFDKVPDTDPGGWGAIPVEVTLGKSIWRTSMFPLKKEGYFLPVKKPILKKENLRAGDKATVKYSTTRGSLF
jgi:hypothetical protein